LRKRPNRTVTTIRGLLYAAKYYRSLMSDHGMVPSMSRKKDCWDSAVAESFFATLKNELLYGRDYRTRDQTLGYRSPLLLRPWQMEPNYSVRFIRVSSLRPLYLLRLSVAKRPLN